MEIGAQNLACVTSPKGNREGGRGIKTEEVRCPLPFFSTPFTSALAMQATQNRALPGRRSWQRGKNTWGGVGGGCSHIVWVGCAAGFAKVLPFT